MGDGALCGSAAGDLRVAISGKSTHCLTNGVNDLARQGLRGVAVGQFIRSAEPRDDKWSVIDVLYDQLGSLGVPILGGLPIGHGPHPATIPLGTTAIRTPRHG